MEKDNQGTEGGSQMKGSFCSPGRRLVCDEQPWDVESRADGDSAAGSTVFTRDWSEEGEA